MKEQLKDLRIIRETAKLSPVFSLCFSSHLLFSVTSVFRGKNPQSSSATHFGGQDVYFVHKNKWILAKEVWPQFCGVCWVYNLVDILYSKGNPFHLH